MKKRTLALIATLVMSENITANEYKVMSNGISLGIQKLDMGGDSDSITSYELGYQMMKGDEIRYGWEFNIGFTSNDSTSSEMIGDISGKLGYAILPNLDLYGTIGYGMQTFGLFISDASGLVYGLGLHYGISEKMGVALSYKKYNLDYDYFDADYDLNAIGVKLDFAF